MNPIEFLDATCKFQIGDILIHRAALATPNKSKREEIGKIIGQYPFHERLFVTERRLHQCSGGVQISYVLAAVDHNGQVRNALHLHEVELALFPAEQVTMNH